VPTARDPILRTSDYSASTRARPRACEAKATALRFHSVRQPEGICWGLFHHPDLVKSVVQEPAHYEMIWEREICSGAQVSLPHIG